MAAIPCFPTHEGPFFFESTGVCRCEGCRQLVTTDQVRDAARALQGGDDGNDLQIARIARAEIIRRADVRELATAADQQAIDAEYLFASS